MVRPASRISSAISFGVLRRSAPSTSLIMRSIKVLPGSAVMRMTSQSETTKRAAGDGRLRSPPASRMTGADSPVIADSLTLATPSTISPSDGIRSLASTSTRLPARRSEAGVGLKSARSFGLTSSFAIVSVRARRRLSARARPRPSATASAKVANSTVSHSQAAMASGNAAGVRFTSASTPMKVVSTATISVTKITGLRIRLSGLSLAKLSPAARAMMAPSNSAMVSALAVAMGMVLSTFCRRAWRNARPWAPARRPA